MQNKNKKCLIEINTLQENMEQLSVLSNFKFRVDFKEIIKTTQLSMKYNSNLISLFRQNYTHKNTKATKPKS